MCSNPWHAENNRVGANFSSKEAGVELLVDGFYLQLGGKDIVS